MDTHNNQDTTNSDDLLVMDEHDEVSIKLDDIDYIESFGNDVFIICGLKTYKTTFRLKDFPTFNNKFIRVNKSYVINKNKIKRIKPSINIKFRILINDVWIDVNRTYYYEFKDHIGI